MSKIINTFMQTVAIAGIAVEIVNKNFPKFILACAIYFAFKMLDENEDGSKP